MHALKRALLPCLVILTLAAFAAGAPVHAAAGDAPQAPLFTRWSDDLVKGAVYYAETVTGWFNAILRLFGVGKGGATGGNALAKTCDVQADCPGGLDCLNTCSGGACDVWQKQCVNGPQQISIEPEYGPCGKDDVCARGTVCTATCPTGASCPVIARCLSIETGTGSCAVDDDCTATCGLRGFPPIGVTALRPMCVSGSCRCKLEEANPDAKPVRCPATAVAPIVCPAGTSPACAERAAGDARMTCLTAPEFGGSCIDDISCRNVSCPADASPFCDQTEQKCRCKATKQETVTCAKDDECGGITCDPGQAKVCRADACACATTTKTEQDIVCAAASDCPATCAQGFQAACVNSKCACQRTVAAPVACTDVSQCGAVSCPDGFDKKCLNSVCSCARTIQQ